MTDRPEEFRYGLGYGTVIAVYPDAWEVDVAMATGGVTRHAQVLGARLPEINAKARPQWVVVGWVDAQHAQAVCWPVPSRLTGPRGGRAGYVLYDERDNYRMTIDAAGNYEVKNTASDAVTRVRIEQAGSFIRIETPSATITLDNAGNLVELDAANIHLGHGAIEKVVLGSTFAGWLQDFIAVFDAHTHPDAGPNSNPAPPLPVILSEVAKTR